MVNATAATSQLGNVVSKLGYRIVGSLQKNPLFVGETFPM